MKIVSLSTEDHAKWNAFVVEHFPPVGAFLESYEWGDFKAALHGKTLRFAIEENGAWIGCFAMEIHTLPLGLSYGYSPRGPVLHKDLWSSEAKIAELFATIGAHIKKEFPHFIFVRLEPPHKNLFSAYTVSPFVHPHYYLQPRFNQLITIGEPEEMLKSFSSDIKHDIRAAERIGTTVTVTKELTPEQSAAFEKMKEETRARSGKSIFPSEKYFKNFMKVFSPTSDDGHKKPQLCYFIASNKDGVPVAINLNLLFGNTLTYLYGASSTGSISKRAPGYLHWKTMDYAREHGFAYYDLGGVSDDLWHGLTYFKRQFGGETLEYVGTVDAVLRPFLYKVYRKARRLQ
jgi:lipid II:glycine glycyltransferase (peptidoglycan interpeptide bridge formation enzyme)